MSYAGGPEGRFEAGGGSPPRLRFSTRPPEDVLVVLRAAGWRWRRDLVAWEGPRGAVPPPGVRWVACQPESSGGDEDLEMGGTPEVGEPGLPGYRALVLSILRTAGVPAFGRGA